MMLCTALKEWASVVAALARGEGTVLLRKGGIVEQTGEFEIERTRCLLFPSTFHPAPEHVRPEARRWLDVALAEQPPQGMVRISAWAEAVSSRPVERVAVARALAPHTLYMPDYAEERFTMQKHRTLQLVTLRVWRLPEARLLPLRREYGGCTSWVDLAEAIDTTGSHPALDDAAFRRACADLERTLAEHAAPV